MCADYQYGWKTMQWCKKSVGHAVLCALLWYDRVVCCMACDICAKPVAGQALAALPASPPPHCAA